MKYSIEDIGNFLLKSATAAIILIVTIFICLSTLRLAVILIERRKMNKHKLVTIEIVPPVEFENSSSVFTDYFAFLHNILMPKTAMSRIFGLSNTVSVEVCANKSNGIRFILVVEESSLDAVTSSISSFLPTAKWRIIETPNLSKATFHSSLKQGNYFAYPIDLNEVNTPLDTIAYLTGAMTKLKPHESVTLQAVITPYKSKRAEILQNKLLYNEAMINDLGGGLAIGSRFGNIVSGLLFAITDGMGNLFHGQSKYRPDVQSEIRNREASSRIKPARALSTIEQDLSLAVRDKLSQPLFSVAMRIGIEGDKRSSSQRQRNILAALNVRTNHKYQSIRVRKLVSNHILVKRYSLRLPGLVKSKGLVLSSDELASIFHFPTNQASTSENVVKSLSKQLPAPISLKQNDKMDVIIGKNVYQGSETLIGLTAAERERHMYIIGGTGNGKTTMMEYAIVQDIRNGKGVAVVDPHGDLAEKLLSYIPEDRINDVIYFNPADLKYPIGLNLLELPEGLEGDDLLDARDFITEAIISIMRKIFSDDDSGGHRIEYILRNTVQTALTIKDSTLFTVFDLLTDAKYRRKIQKSLTDQKLKNFWVGEFGKAGDMQKIKMAAGVTAKIGRFQFSASAERILSQPKSTINFEEILDGKILICNLAKGLVGEDTSELFGISILAKLQLAAYRRVKLRQENRKPFFIYVDEFQNFATVSFVQLLSEARKYKVFLTMAEQSTSQQEEQRMVNTIFANVGTIICFRSGNPADETMVLPLFSPYVEPGELANLPTYNFYARLSATKSQEPLSGMTIVLSEKPSDLLSRKVIESSRLLYATQHQDNQAKTSRQTSSVPIVLSEAASMPGDK